MDPTLSQALVGLIVACTAVLGALAVRIKSAAKANTAATVAAHADLKTNHGKRPGEYLEMVADVQVDVQALAHKVDKVIALIADHTVQDATNFSELRALVVEAGHKADVEIARAEQPRHAAAD